MSIETSPRSVAFLISAITSSQRSDEPAFSAKIAVSPPMIKASPNAVVRLFKNPQRPMCNPA
jgi:hypothetical protein